MKKRKEADLKGQYRKMLELGLVISLALHILLLQAYKKVEERAVVQQVKLEALSVEEIPQTIQEKSAPAPSRPTIPIASEDEELSEDETMDFTDFDFDSEPPPPPPPPDAGASDEVFFVAFEEAPEPIGGWSSLQANLVYPEIAMKAGIEGTVRVNAHIDVNGNVLHTRILEGITGCNEAAMEAVKKTKWKPAMQREQPVEVWVAIPVRFQLKKN
ncbi:energy transducer TonB [bacterium]|nr:energy transducer TonB [bacterium]